MDFKHILLLIVLGDQANKITASSSDHVNVNLFELISVALPDIGKWIKSEKFDDIDLPNINEIGYYSLYLTNGKLSNLHEIAQHLDTMVIYRNNAMYIQIGMTFKKLYFQYDYEMTIMGFSPIGLIDGSIENVKFNIDLRIDMINMKIDLSHFESSIESIEIYLQGNVMYDWLANQIIKLVKSRIKRQLEELMAVDVKNLLLERLSRR